MDMHLNALSDSPSNSATTADEVDQLIEQLQNVCLLEESSSAEPIHSTEKQVNIFIMYNMTL